MNVKIPPLTITPQHYLSTLVIRLLVAFDKSTIIIAQPAQCITQNKYR